MRHTELGKLDRAQSAPPQIAAELRRRILALSLPPNTALSRHDLQKEFGVSLTPVRDALLQLSDEQLVTIYPQAGTYVSPISLARVYRGHFLRSALEFQLVRILAEQENAALVARLVSIVAEQETITSPSEYERFEQLDRQFHWSLFEAGQMEPLWNTVRKHSGDIDRLRRLTLPRPGKMESILRGHRAVIANLAAKSPEGAFGAMREHLSETLSLAEQVRAAHPDFFVE